MIEIVINIELLAAWISTIAVIIMPITFVIKKYNAILKKMDAIQSWTKSQQKDIEDGKQNRLALNKSLLHIAQSMKAQGFNGTIDKAIETLEDTILIQQVDGISYPERKK